MTCPECHKHLEIAVCLGPHPRFREIYLTPARIEYFRERQEQERRERRKA